MDVKFINPFLQGTIEVLKKMTFVEPMPGKVYLKETTIAHGDVSGIIGITGDAIGSLAISFSEACICHLISGMLGEHYTEVNQDVFDGVGEITNMISGVARTYMEKEGMSVYAAIPSVVYGKEHTINHILKSPSIMIPFVTDAGSFVVDVCIQRTWEETKEHTDYHVLNRKTSVDLETPAKQNADSRVQSETGVDKKTLLKKKLSEIMTIRDDMVRQLSEKPFMEISKRQLLKKRIPLLDTQIRRLKLDLSTMEMLAKISNENLDHPALAKHYQHYEPVKRKP